jgi:hypothetical protein
MVHLEKRYCAIQPQRANFLPSTAPHDPGLDINFFVFLQQHFLISIINRGGPP